MLDILAIVAPIFLVVGAGYVASLLGLFSDEAVDSLMLFVMRFAVAALLFRASATIDVGAALAPRLLAAYYLPALACFVIGMITARRLFRHTPGESVTAGFNALFANTLFLGMPIIHRAYGEASDPYVFALISIHAPVMYTIGVVAMETSARDGAGAGAALRKVWRSLSRNPLVIAVASGFVWNATGLPIPSAADDALQLLTRAALPAGMFAIGAALTRYRIAGALHEALFLVFLKLAVHPALALGMASLLFGSGALETKSIALMAAIPGGMNIYIFAVLYNRMTTLAASCLLLGTALSVVTVPIWLAILG